MSTRPGPTGTDLEWSVRAIATEEALSGVVRLDLDGEIAAEVAFGQSHRGLGVEMTTSTQLAIASGNKAFTALVVMSLVNQGVIAEELALQQHERLTEIKMRLLGDRVSRRTAWRIAREHGCETIFDAEYLAVCTLQADALITIDRELALKAAGILTLAPLDALPSD